MKASGRPSAATTLPDVPGSPSPPRRFALAGPSRPLDPATNAYRPDVADVALAGQVIASHYAEPLVRRCRTDTPLAADPKTMTAGEAGLLEGEPFAVLDCGRGLAWGYRVSDHRVGYVALADLASA